MTLELYQTAGIAVVIFLATILQSAAGFGFGMLAMAALPVFLPFTAVSMGLPFLLLPIMAVNFAVRWRSFRWRPVVPLILGLALGVVPGVYLLGEVREDVLKRLLGLILLVSVVLRYQQGRQVAKRRRTDGVANTALRPFSRWIALSCGFAGGILGGAFNTGGPPIILYLYGRPWPVDRIVASLHLLGVFSTILKLAFGAWSGLLESQAGALGLVGALPMLAGLYLGIRIGGRIPGSVLRNVAFVFVAVFGLHLLVFG